MALPKAFYAEPRIRKSSPDLLKLREATAFATELTLETPGIALALAMDYYRVEMFATKKDCDEACGPTGHKDVAYFPTTRNTLIRAGISLEDISCGHPVGHPNFCEVLTPLFDAAARRLIEQLIRAPAEHDGIVASTMIPIARARYTIRVISTADWLDFEVEALSAFEQQERDVMDQTVRYLEGGLALRFSPALGDAKCN